MVPNNPPHPSKTIFVSGCYDILHAGHLQFFSQAKALGTHLTVSFASTEVLQAHKNRRPSIPDDHKLSIISSLRMVDHVVIGDSTSTIGLDFIDYFLSARPDVLVATTDDKYGDIKRALCQQTGSEYVILPKTPPNFTPVSTSSIIQNIRAPAVVPLRVDFAGGWLDVPRLAVPDGFIVNCTISPLVSLENWPYNLQGGLGGSGAWALLSGSGDSNDAVDAELDLGVGWQDPAIISETGLCSWASGPRPKLDVKIDPTELLRGKMGIMWTGAPHDTPATAKIAKDLVAIKAAGLVARRAAWEQNFSLLCEAVTMSYDIQLAEGMDSLHRIEGATAMKYLGGGFGGYALYIFQTSDERDKVSEPEFKVVEPFIRS